MMYASLERAGLQRGRGFRGEGPRTPRRRGRARRACPQPGRRLRHAQRLARPRARLKAPLGTSMRRQLCTRRPPRIRCSSRSRHARPTHQAKRPGRRHQRPRARRPRAPRGRPRPAHASPRPPAAAGSRRTACGSGGSRAGGQTTTTTRRRDRGPGAARRARCARPGRGRARACGVHGRGRVSAEVRPVGLRRGRAIWAGDGSVLERRVTPSDHSARGLRAGVC